MPHDMLESLWRESSCQTDMLGEGLSKQEQHNLEMNVLSPYLINKADNFYNLFHKKEIFISGSAHEILQLLVSLIPIGIDDHYKKSAVAMMAGILFSLVELRSLSNKEITIDTLDNWCYLPAINDLLEGKYGSLNDSSLSAIRNGLSLIPHWNLNNSIEDQEPAVTQSIRHIYQFWHRILAGTQETDTVLYGLCYLQAFADFLLQHSMDANGLPGILNKQVKSYLHPSEYTVNKQTNRTSRILHVELPQEIKQVIQSMLGRSDSKAPHHG